MIDLNQIIEQFLDEALWQCRHDGLKEDDAVLRFLNDRNQSTDARRAEVLKWLRYYGVLQGLNGDDRYAVAGVIIEFADARGAIGSPASEVEIIEKFNDLHDRCRSKVRLTKSETARNLTSLTSKALWCCYPDAVPIFDSYARRALWVVSRLMGLDRPHGKDDDIPYPRFVSVWLNLYRGVRIDDARLGDYPYKVRVFDRILWIIGQPDYGDTRRQLGGTSVDPVAATSRVRGAYRLEVNGQPVNMDGAPEKKVIELGRCLRAALPVGTRVEYRCVQMDPTSGQPYRSWHCPMPRNAATLIARGQALAEQYGLP